VAAIENACLDISAKALGVPVHALFGGPFRQRVSVYWSHCASLRARHPAFFESLGYEPLRTVADFTRLAREAVAQGFQAVKTNPVFFDKDNRPFMFNAGFRIAPGLPSRAGSLRPRGSSPRTSAPPCSPNGAARRRTSPG
jgi:hypothetical protein